MNRIVSSLSLSSYGTSRSYLHIFPSICAYGKEKKDRRNGTADDEKVITTGGVVGVFVSDGGYCDSKCNKDGNCGVTMTCKAETPLPKPGTIFPEYGPKKGLTGNEVEEKLSDLYPGLKIYIIEDGSPVTMEILQNRVRVFVDSNDSDVDDDDLGGRFVVKIPRVG